MDTFLLYLFMAGIVYGWLQYVMAVEQAPHRNRKINQFAILFPFMISTIVLIINYIAAPGSIVSDELVVQPTFTIYLLIVPIIYLVATLFYALRQARKEEDRQEKRKHLFIGMLPMATLVIGVVQQLFAQELPIYCFADSLLMFLFYIQSSEGRVSLDPLLILTTGGGSRDIFHTDPIFIWKED